MVKSEPGCNWIGQDNRKVLYGLSVILPSTKKTQAMAELNNK